MSPSPARRRRRLASHLRCPFSSSCHSTQLTFTSSDSVHCHSVNISPFPCLPLPSLPSCLFSPLYFWPMNFLLEVFASASFVLSPSSTCPQTDENQRWDTHCLSISPSHLIYLFLPLVVSPLHFDLTVTDNCFFFVFVFVFVLFFLFSRSWAFSDLFPLRLCQSQEREKERRKQ